MKVDMVNLFSNEIEEVDCYKLPRIVANHTDSDFSNALAIDMRLDDEGENNKDEIVDMVHSYSASFWSGFEPAGVNLLRHLFLVKVNAKACTGDTDALAEKYEAVVEELCKRGNHAGAYYHALTLIFGIVDNGKSDDENIDAGVTEMYRLAYAGNPYALIFVMSVET